MHVQTSNQPVVQLGFGNWSANWGFHMCGLYETEEERDNIIMGFLNRGNRGGDLQFYCPSERSPEDFHEEYARRFPEEADHTHDPNRFQIFEACELYYPEGSFSPQSMDERLNAFFAESQKNGPKNIRATAEMSWAVEAVAGVEHLMVYESRLNYFIPGKPWISICLYNLNKFSGSMIMDVLRTHPFTVTGGTIFRNPYFVSPDRWLEMNAPKFSPQI